MLDNIEIFNASKINQLDYEKLIQTRGNQLKIEDFTNISNIMLKNF